MRKQNLLSIILAIGLMANIAFADQYVLVMSKDDEVCQPMLKLYNDDLKERGKITLENHREFNWVKWKDADVDFIRVNVKSGVWTSGAFPC